MPANSTNDNILREALHRMERALRVSGSPTSAEYIAAKAAVTAAFTAYES